MSFVWNADSKQLAQWKAHINQVAAKVDSRWNSLDEDGSHQSADMMKHKLTSSNSSIDAANDVEVSFSLMNSF